MNTKSLYARKVPFGQMFQPGDFCFSEDLSYIYVWLPGAPGPDALRIARGPAPDKERWWGWDGNEDKPTLTPSILDPGHWHGYLTAGFFRSC